MSHQYPSTTTHERVRKPYLIVLCGILTLTCGGLSEALIEARATPKPHAQPIFSDLDSNGFIVSGTQVSVDDADPGSCPVRVYAHANTRLHRLAHQDDLLDEKGRSKVPTSDPNNIRQIVGLNPEVRIFLVPDIDGYELIILSSRRLTKEEDDRVKAYSMTTIQEAVEEWNSKPSHKKGWIP